MSGVKRKRISDSPPNLKCTDGPSDTDKKSIFTIHNFVKEPSTNGTPRLQSFRPPRDLSLGGTKPKKVYTPNLNVTRARNKQKECVWAARNDFLNLLFLIISAPVKETTRSARIREGKAAAANRNKFIQLQGVFSQGVGEARLKNGFSESRASYNRSHDMPVAKVRKREVSDSFVFNVGWRGLSVKIERNLKFGLKPLRRC